MFMLFTKFRWLSSKEYRYSSWTVYHGVFSYDFVAFWNENSSIFDKQGLWAFIVKKVILNLQSYFLLFYEDK